MKAYATKRSSTGGREYLSITILPDLSKDGYSREQISIGAETKNTDTTWGYSTTINTYSNECYSLVICKAIVQILEKSGKHSLEHLNPVDLVETLNQLKYKKVCYHEGMGHYYTQKDWPEGTVYRLDIGDKFEKTFAGKTEAEALKQKHSLEHLNPVDLVETLNQLKYKKVCYHEGMGHYYTQKDWPEGLIYRLDIGDKFEKTFAGKTEAEALKQARKYVLSQLEYSSAKKWLDWIAEPKVEFYKCGQTYYESSVLPGNTMNLDIIA